ncbi:hypothetical protein GCM10027445_31880 [Amycolatopsis endophytica]|uniref:PE-PPE domain-containing protein n=1 Tax=Amycolatopsis endophytica TaxID=860233 RepID=A0A853B1R8_9PSEU|nr:PE-PPE domain-containing protein [Amycolatopsis endophytica]NYI88812.1 hypothetical protein [Amycolatopsis endophytica]
MVLSRTKRVVTGLAALAMAGGLAVTGAQTASADPSCAHTKIFELGGTGHGDGSDFDGFNATVPAGVATEKVVYPAEIAPLPGHRLTMDQSVAEGMANLDRAVRDFHAACGDSTIIITGYSLGALVAGNELEALSHSGDIPHGQLKGVLYGDPRRPGDPAAGGDGSAAGGAGGIATNLPTFVGGITLQGPRPDYGDVVVKQICNQNDGICNSVNPFTNLAAFANGVAGYLLGDHNSYVPNPLVDVDQPSKFVQQAPRIQYGPPLPVPVPNPWVMFNGNFQPSQDAVRGIRDAARTALPPQLWQQLVAQWPWIEQL